MTDATDERVARETIHLRMDDGATADLLFFCPRERSLAALLWVPALGVAARHYEPFARALAAHGITVGIHEWRGHGSSDRRAGRRCDWGYRELLTYDLPRSLDTLATTVADVPLHVGGHSLGGQLACLLAGMTPHELAGVALVASGAPYWRRFPPWVLFAYVAAPMLAHMVGRLPGRRIGFGGNEARGVIADWSRSGRRGVYAAVGLAVDLEAALGRQRAPVRALRLQDDWLAPASSLDFLLDKMPDAPRDTGVVTPDELGGERADHFAWMKQPASVARRLANGMLQG
ncbi:Predicted alpha/beta hydrolase [Luteibacter sp. UNC138MFCol5.1]|uniref:alpha/beta hydrolase family protein n=1 Tax=Luteibacter sp. UNC138MFCol5.1 TaxID=1502774 RepID=UPI0008C3684D|nr:alpha/beta fold hydrolase [Luteibacter sp. UNC138MFCol5.1]SEO59514.1 Predicted alpha/beta hydrolase [Luteibacter sp. UNC138MFCol5.1]